MLWRSKKSGLDGASLSAGTSVSRDVEEGMDPAQSSGRMPQSGVANVDVISKRADGSYIIPRGYRISGRVITSRPVVVEGRLEGPVLVAPSVHVGPDGHLNLPVQAASVTVEGIAMSAISARDLVEVRRGGEVKGDVEASTLRIAPGGVVSGVRLAIGPLRAAPG
jgi:cytoskeletal protein CcmA (bactofilin family)